MRIVTKIIAAVVAVGGVGVAVLAGHQIAQREVGAPDAFLTKVANRVIGAPDTDTTVALTDQTLSSALLNIDMTVFPVETERTLLSPLQQSGGGLTSFGDDVILLPYAGQVYAADGVNPARATQIVAPSNGRAEYEALKQDPDYADYQIVAGYIRYNDIEHIVTDEGQAFVASYTEYDAENVCYTNTLARLDFPQDVTSVDDITAGPDDWDIIFRTAPCLAPKSRYFAIEGHLASGRLAYDPESQTLYLSSGDFHLDGMRSDTAPIAQDPVAQYGKILAMNPDGSDARIVSMGHRNVQGVVRAPDGRIFAAEHGPQGGDEVNLISEGNNYGWPTESYGISYSSTPIPGSASYGRHDTFSRPIHSWVPSVATSGLTAIDGFDPSWDGDLLVASLIDNALFRLRLVGEEVIYQERINIGSRLRDVHQHTDGSIAIWTDSGEFVFLTAQPLPDRAFTVERFIERREVSASLAGPFETAMSDCAQCHSFLPDQNENAPSLARIFNNEIASSSFDAYSDALKAREGSWDKETLIEFLLDPQAFAPGTQMPGLEDPAIADLVADYLRRLDRTF